MYVTALYSVLAVFVLRSLGIGTEGVSLGGLSVYPYDVVFVILLAAYLMRLMHELTATRLELLWLLFGCLGLLSFVRGASIYGLALAGDVRPVLYAVVAFLYFSRAPTGREEMERVTVAWMASAAVLAVVALALWATGGYATLRTGVTPGLASRILHAEYAFHIMQGGLIAFYIWIAHAPWGRVWRHLVWLALPIVVLLQYRTVWVVFVVAVLFLILRRSGGRVRILSTLTVIALIGTVSVLAVFGRNLDTLARYLTISVDEAFSSNSTFAWRLEGWSEIFTRFFSFGLDAVIGVAAGELRTHSAEFWFLAHAHSEYVNTLLRSGIACLAILLWTYYALVRSLRTADPGTASGTDSFANLLYILVITQIVYALTYDMTPVQYVLLGVTAGYLCRPKMTHLERWYENEELVEAGYLRGR